MNRFENVARTVLDNGQGLRDLDYVERSGVEPLPEVDTLCQQYFVVALGMSPYAPGERRVVSAAISLSNLAVLTAHIEHAANSTAYSAQFWAEVETVLGALTAKDAHDD